FRAETFPQIDPKVWVVERERAKDLINPDCSFHAYGSDIDPAAIEIAEENARRAGVEDRITFEVRDLKDFTRRSDRGTVICNPPYGERLMEVKEAEALYRTMGQVFPRERGWAYYIISPSEDFEKLFGRRADKRRKLYNGMIKCQYYMYFK
ncbi:MAG: methyltransferase, partial [Clostridia bacterium]|nr:methyltransferase [Clostridia bacterium]